MAKKFYGGEMISSNYSEMANLPQQVIIKKYPEGQGYSDEMINDGISGIDSQMSKDNSKKKKNKQPEKY